MKTKKRPGAQSAALRPLVFLVGKRRKNRSDVI